MCVKERFRDARVIVFGSIVRGEWTVNSDVDILIVSKQIPEEPIERAKISVSLRSIIGDLSAPFEFHYATPEQYERWYKRFINEWIEM